MVLNRFPPLFADRDKKLAIQDPNGLVWGDIKIKYGEVINRHSFDTYVLNNLYNQKKIGILGLHVPEEIQEESKNQEKKKK